MRKGIFKSLATFGLAVCVLGTSITLPSMESKAAEESWLLSLNRPAYASSVNGNDIPTRATDGDIGTQWGAKWETSNQWLDVDLGAAAQVDRVKIIWQNPMTYATKYKIQVSADELNWTTIYTKANGDGGTQVPDSNGNPYCVEEINLSGSGRYVRLLAETCVSGFGVAVYEFEIYGKGGINEKPRERTNLALNRTSAASSYAVPWWVGDSIREKAPEKAVDGNKNSNWLSEGTNDEWFQVNLGAVYKVGQVNISWEVEFGRVYEIQTSLDGENWEVAYRQLAGLGEDEQIAMYKDAKYVRMQGIAMGRGSGYSIRELEVYEYEEGDSKTNPQIPTMPTPEVIKVGEGSYYNNDLTMYHPRTPKYVTDNVTTPIPSNDWWTSIIYTRLSDGIPALPLMFKYSETGLGMYYASDLFTAPDNGGMDTKSNTMDLTIGAANILKTPEARVDGYGDYSVDVIYSDDTTPKLRSTLIKGSPYVYNTFSDPNSVEISAQAIERYFNDNNQAILVNDGDTITADHIGIEVSNTNTAPVTKNQIRSYGIFAPEGTKFTRLGNKIKIQLGSGQNYMTVGTLTKPADLNYMYQHAYAIVKNTTVSYGYNEGTANMTTTFKDTVEVKRNGFSSDTLMALMPHQWKYSSNALTNREYRSARGTMKVLEGKEFSTTLRFQGITPSFGEPTESSTYNRADMLAYLETFKESVVKDYWVADPYWQGKKTHPLAMGILIADELGEYETRDQFITILRNILQDWFTYDSPEDIFYMYYSSSWGTINGEGGDHGMGINLSDHHFLWAYFIFPAAVLASYDSEFVEGYGEMVEHLIRDAMNPSKTDALYPFMRNFDPYEGHSWAGGYGDNQSGNNQESASEATFAWAGLYLWGLVTGNDTYRDAGIWGFTSEVNAIEQYWFNYDDDNWAEDYERGCVGMVWGSAYTYGTYFSGNPCCIYGIHWLPVTPVMTYMGYRPDQAAAIYSQYESDQVSYQQKLAASGNTDPEGWFHILWPFQANSNPEAVMQKWDTTELPNDEIFNTYWYIQNMAAKGLREVSVWSNNYTSYQVFKKGNTYSAVIWNPTNEEKYVEFCNAEGTIGSAYINPNTTITVNPFMNNGHSSKFAVAVAAKAEAHAIPSKIEAEDYYTNFSCSVDVASEGGKCMAFISNNSYCVYEVDVAEEGDYPVQFRVINGSGKAGEIQIKSDLSGAEVLATAAIPVNNQWATVTTNVHLKAGKQKLKLLFSKGGFNFNWFQIGEGEDNPGTGTLSGTNLALGKTATASSSMGENAAAQAVDGNAAGTRWESEHTDNQWISVDLGQSYEINGVRLVWEAAAGKNYTIEVSDNGTNWTTVYTKTNGTGGTEEITFAPVNARYVRMNGTARTSGYGFSLWEFEIYGGGSSQEDEVVNVALNKTASASTSVGGNTAAQAVDGNATGTRWESEHADNQWISVDLGASYEICKVKLIWEAAAGKDYTIDVSDNGTNWTTVSTKTNGIGGTEEITFAPVNARYVRMNGSTRTSGYGFSLWEFEVYGKASSGDTPGGNTEQPGTPIGKIQAEDYTAMEGVDVEDCNDEGGKNVGWIDAGDYMDYVIQVPKAGTYKADFRVKGWSTDAKLRIMVNNQTLSTALVYTDNAWSTVTAENFTLPEGTVTVRIYVESGGFNFNWFEIK